MKTYRLILATSVVFAFSATGTVHAATIEYDFTGNTASPTFNDFGSGVTAGNIMTSFTGAANASIANSRWQRRLRDDSTATMSFTVTIPDGVVIDLSDLSFIDGIDSPSAPNDSFSRWDLAVSTGSATPNFGTRSLAKDSSLTSGSNNVTLSGLTGLTDTSVTFTWTVNYGVTSNFSGSGDHSHRHAFLDDVVLTGAVAPAAVIPEPSTYVLGLLGLVGFALLAWRRRRGK